MDFDGHIKSSFIDYPNRISTVVFTGGCNFRCSYCHNSHIVNGEGDKISEEEIFGFLNKRRKFIDAVCICGGEPTMHDNIYDFIKRIKKNDFLVKLDTNGTNPKLLERVIDEGLLDYIAMDIKAPLVKYQDIVKTKVDTSRIKESIDIIKNSGLEYEFRTTICRELLSKEDMIEISQELQGTKRYIIQNFKDSDSVLEGKGRYTNYSKEELEEIKVNLEDNFGSVEIRY